MRNVQRIVSNAKMRLIVMFANQDFMLTVENVCLVQLLRTVLSVRIM